MILFMILCAHERKLLVSSKIVYALLVHCAKLKLSYVLLAYFNSTLKKESNVSNRRLHLKPKKIRLLHRLLSIFMKQWKEPKLRSFEWTIWLLEVKKDKWYANQCSIVIFSLNNCRYCFLVNILMFKNRVKMYKGFRFHIL